MLAKVTELVNKEAQVSGSKLVPTFFLSEHLLSRTL